MRSRLVGTVLLLVMFVAGALAGAAVMRVAGAEKAPAERRVRDVPPMRGGPRRLLLDEQFSKELGLTAEQRTRIKEILDRRDAEAKKLWEGVEPQLKEFGKQVHDEIETVLTPEQQKKLDAALEQRREKWKKQRANCPPDSARMKEKQS